MPIAQSYFSNWFLDSAKQIALSAVNFAANTYASYKIPQPKPDKDYAILQDIFHKCGHHPRNADLQALVGKLTPETRDKFYRLVYKEGGNRPAPDPREWGKQHAYNNYDRVKKVIREIASAAFDALSPEQRKAIGEKIRANEGASRRLDATWGERHAKDKPELLLAQLNALNVAKAQRKAWQNYEANLKNKSSIYDLHKPELPKGQIGFINGMGTTLENAKKYAKRISKDLSKGHNIHGVHAATNGTKWDKFEAVLGYSGIATTPAFLLRKQWTKFFDTADAETPYLQICCSKGAVHVKTALQEFDRNLAKRITVLAVAPADFIPKGLCGRIRHFVIKEDSVPHLSPNASRIYAKDEDIVILPKTDMEVTTISSAIAT